MTPLCRISTAAAVALIFCPSLLLRAQEKKEAGTPHASAAPKHHSLPATPETVQWGWLDPKEKPKLTINSGDAVSVETMMHSLDQVKPGVPMEELVRLRMQNTEVGPHSVTGPIWVTRAMPVAP